MIAPVYSSVSAIWSMLSGATRLGGRLGLIRAVRLEGCRVVSVGNIQAGGTGKTPLVARIAREAAERGLSVVILLRGYGGEWERSGGGVILPGDLAPDPRLSGDEAALLHELAPGAALGVGPDRALQYRRACEKAGRRFDLAVLDDGFQNRRIVKDLEIVAVTSAPRSQAFFREFSGALRHAQLLVWTKGGVRPEVPADRPLVRVRYELPRASGGAICLVTGVGDPESVLDSARRAGYDVARQIRLGDHARYEAGWVRSVLESAQAQGLTVVTTGKDWVKWKALGIAPEVVRVLEPELVFEEGRAQWERNLWG